MPITGTASPSVGTGPTASPGGLRCRVRLADGRMFSGELPAVRHRALQLGMLHADSDGLVELAAGRRRDGRLRSPPASEPTTSCPGGPAGTATGWARLLALAEQSRRAAARRCSSPPPCATSRAATRTRSPTRAALWIDVDRPGQLPALWALLASTPCHLLIESGGSGGVARLLEARPAAPATLGVTEEAGGVDRADRARAPAAHPPPRRSTTRASRTSRTRSARTAHE